MASKLQTFLLGAAAVTPVGASTLLNGVQIAQQTVYSQSVNNVHFTDTKEDYIPVSPHSAAAKEGDAAYAPDYELSDLSGLATALSSGD